MQFGEAAAVLLSPLHWASMQLRGIGRGQSGGVEIELSRRALLIRKSGLFDTAYYLA